MALTSGFFHSFFFDLAGFIVSVNSPHSRLVPPASQARKVGAFGARIPDWQRHVGGTHRRGRPSHVARPSSAPFSVVVLARCGLCPVAAPRGLGVNGRGANRMAWSGPARTTAKSAEYAKAIREN